MPSGVNPRLSVFELVVAELFGRDTVDTSTDVCRKEKGLCELNILSDMTNSKFPDMVFPS